MKSTRYEPRQRVLVRTGKDPVEPIQRQEFTKAQREIKNSRDTQPVSRVAVSRVLTHKRHANQEELP